MTAKQQQTQHTSQCEENSTAPEQRLDANSIDDQVASSQRQEPHRVPAHIEQGKDATADGVRNGALHGLAEDDHAG